jgi:serine acetyltransferase
MTMSLVTLRQDWAKNRVSVKSLFIVLSYRFSSWFAQHPASFVRFLGLPVRVFYKLIVEFVLGVELPDKVRSGPGLAVFHGVGLVVNHKTILGRNVTLRQNTTIGSKLDGGPAPVIGDSVSIGANAVIIGDIKIGADCSIGAGAIVVETCEPGSVVTGHKAKVKKIG